MILLFTSLGPYVIFVWQGFCTETCASGDNPLWLPICTSTFTCPPEGVAGYKLKWSATLGFKKDEFDSAKQELYKSSLANFLTTQGAAVAAADVELAVSKASGDLRPPGSPPTAQ